MILKEKNIIEIEEENPTSSFQNIQESMKEKEEKDKDQYLDVIQRIQFYKWIYQINLVIGIGFHKKIHALIEKKYHK